MFGDAGRARCRLVKHGRSFRLLDRTHPDRHRLLNPRLYLVEIIRNRYDLCVLTTPTDHVAHTPAALVFQLHIG